MNRSWSVAIVVAALLLAAFTPLAMAQGNDNGTEDRDRDDRDRAEDRDDRDDRDRNETEDGDDRRDRGRDRAERARLMGDLTLENGSASGAFVAFDFDEETGAVTDWSYANETILDSLTWDAWNLTELRAHGSVFEAASEFDMETDRTENSTAANQDDEDGNQSEEADRNETDKRDEAAGNGTEEMGDGNGTEEMDDEADGNGTEEDDEADDEPDRRIRLRAHDNPTGFIKVDIDGEHSATWTFADATNVTQADNWTVEVTTDDGFHAVLWKDRDADESGFDVDGQTVSLEVSEKARVMWRVGASSSGPGPGPDVDEELSVGGDDRRPSVSRADVDRDVSRAASQGRLQAEVSVALPDAASDRARDAVADTPASDVITYGNNTVRPQAQKGRVDLHLECDEPGTIVVTLDKQVMNVSSVDDVEVTFDNESIPAADDLDDVLEPADDPTPEFLLLVGSESVQAMIGVNECSPHTVSIQEAGSAETPSLPGFGAVVALAALAGVAAVWMRRRR